MTQHRTSLSHDVLERAHVVFWDFDGVIKDSVEVKSVGFERLFLPYGRDVAARVRAHHEANGGLSRYEKMPVYLGWAGEPAGPDQVATFCERFSDLVLQAVIDAPWVPGVREYLEAHHARQPFVLVTATPQREIEAIVAALELTRCFREVWGAPVEKAIAIGDVLSRWDCPARDALVVGDAESDLKAARANHVPFLLRRTSLNVHVQRTLDGPMFNDLADE